MTLAELVQASRRLLRDDYMINPNRKPGLYAVEIDNIPLFYAETLHVAELIAQILLAAAAESISQGSPSDVPSDETIET